MQEHPLTKLIKILDYRIADHSMQIENEDLKEEVLKKRIAKGMDDLQRGRSESAVVVRELILAKDKVLFHKAAIAELTDLKGIIENAIKTP
jgi:hypothetical protein